ncbi:MAG: NYN domain-containing protein [Syntrophobacteraceae bacterium]
MELEPKVNEILSNLPALFYDRLIRDIPAITWVRILASNPILKKEVLEGFSLQPGKFSRMITQPVIMGRLLRRLQNDGPLLEKILTEWREEHGPIISYLAMLDSDFLTENWRKIKDLLGPERFCIGLYALGLLNRKGFRSLLEEESFWSTRPDESLFDLLVPVLSAWGGFIEKHPELAKKFLESEKGTAFAFDLEGEEIEQKTRQNPELQDRFKKVEKKLEKTQVELNRAGEQMTHLRGENEELRKKLRELEGEFDRKVSESIARQRREWFERYQYMDREGAAKDAERLESLLQRTRRALELQKKADEEYGLVADIRAKMLEIELSLTKIETVYADSLVVHKEVEKVKEALINEKNRLLKLPGIRRIIGTRHEGGKELIGQINLLEPVPSNLPKVSKLLKMAQQLSEIGMCGDPGQVEEAVRHKKRQILERLYSQFEPRLEDVGRERPFRDFAEFVGAGETRKYTLYVDGYNVLLRVHGEKQFPQGGFTHFREQFIEAVIAGSRHFANVCLVFDGIEDSRDIQGNTEIIYTDKTRISADSVIIQRITTKRDKNNLLVTADQEIISSVQGRVFALVDPVAFYMFLYE